ncbi:hypothetical protein C1H46_034840 [Malus baccata]|uniref:Peptidase M24 domain-containing protein n=1 Tax=Malus baccata TaxID=106549 RepID=A0A540KZG7_MALBA|nr:hypothetical protein C1H46_034840 [Malus baccata]
MVGGKEQNRYDTDYFQDVATGKSILFAPRLPAEYAVWLGEIKPERYMVSTVYYTNEITSVLHDEYKGSGKPLLFLLHGLGTDDSQNLQSLSITTVEICIYLSLSSLGGFKDLATSFGIDKFDTDLTTLHPVLTECRVTKSDLELALIQFANDISSDARVEVMRKVREGMYEYQLESMFLHHTYMYGGCRHCSYTCICATGDNSAVLHYGHAEAPNDKILEDGDLALLDMGSEYNFYGSDITCSYPVNGKLSPDQALIYNAFLDAHNAVISTMKPGVSWLDMHKLAEKVILESLKRGRILVGTADDMMVERLGAVFMPHGLGHLLGIDTHDPGGYPKGTEGSKEPGLKPLCTTRELQEGMPWEIQILLKFFNYEAANRFKGSGGVQIESDVLVTANGCKNMTKVPQEISEIEAVMAGAPWPLDKSSSGEKAGQTTATSDFDVLSKI